MLGIALAITSAVSQDEIPPSHGGADQSQGTDGGFPVAGLVTVLAPILLPKFAADACMLREFIRGEEFAGIRASCGDPAAVDSIFSVAKELSWGNLYEALLISALATLDHRRVGVRLPLIGPLLWFPLTSEFEEDFQLRLEALPRRFYADTPPGPAGDRDKLQHFFGSAFLAALSESRDAAERVGDFVEWGEERFIVGGVNDERDARANRQGQEFALRILADRNAMPSRFLLSGPEEHMSIDAAPCARGTIPRSTGTGTEER